MKRFGEFVAVDDVSFEVEEGEFVTLLGASGCGKTTTLKMINRLIEPTAGEVLFDDINLLQASEAEMIDFAVKYDPQPMHTDPEAAANSPFGGLIASG